MYTTQVINFIYMMYYNGIIKIEIVYEYVIFHKLK